MTGTLALDGDTGRAEAGTEGRTYDADGLRRRRTCRLGWGSRDGRPRRAGSKRLFGPMPTQPKGQAPTHQTGGQQSKEADRDRMSADPSLELADPGLDRPSPVASFSTKNVVGSPMLALGAEPPPTAVASPPGRPGRMLKAHVPRPNGRPVAGRRVRRRYLSFEASRCHAVVLRPDCRSGPDECYNFTGLRVVQVCRGLLEMDAGYKMQDRASGRTVKPVIPYPHFES